MSWISALTARAAVCLLAAGFAGCATGPVGPAPPVRNPANAGTVTVFRDGAWAGLWAPVILRIDGNKVFRVGRNEEYTFLLDPGEYIFDFAIGFNECRRVAVVYPRRSYRYRLTPNCSRFDWNN